jgi:hypothetical protein
MNNPIYIYIYRGGEREREFVLKPVQHLNTGIFFGDRGKFSLVVTSLRNFFLHNLFPFGFESRI